jgi:hypothetical protein
MARSGESTATIAKQMNRGLDAGNYIIELPRKDKRSPEWHDAAEALILVAEKDSPTMFARIGFMRALNHHHVREFNPDRKDHHWGKRKLKRDEWQISRVVDFQPIPCRAQRRSRNSP